MESELVTPVRYVTIENYRLAYREQGSGYPLVCVHGYPLTSLLWEPQLQGLSGTFRVIAPDLRGHGSSDLAPGPYWMDTFANDLDRFLDAIDIPGPVLLCGLSMGGYVALAYFREHSPRLAGLVLAATRAAGETAEGIEKRDQAIEKVKTQGPGAVIDGMLPNLFADETVHQRDDLLYFTREMMEQVPAQTMIYDLEGMKERPDSTETLYEIALPTLLLHGAEDKIIPASEAEKMHDQIENSQLKVLKEAGHLLNLEQPQAFNQAVQNFYASRLVG